MISLLTINQASYADVSSFLLVNSTNYFNVATNLTKSINTRKCDHNKAKSKNDSPKPIWSLSGIRSSPGLLFKTSSRGLEKSLLGLCSQSPRRNEKAFSPNFRRMDRRRLHRAKNAQSSYLRQLVSCISTEQDPLVPLLQNSEQIPRSFQLQNGNPTGVEKVHREGLLDDLDRYQERVPTSQDSSKRSKQTCFHSIGKDLEVQDDAFWSEYSSVHLDSPIQPSSESRKKGRDKDVLLHGRMYHLRSHTSGMRQSYRQILRLLEDLGL